MGSDSRKTKAQLIGELALARQCLSELQKSEIQHSTILEKSNDAIIVLQDGLVKFANSKAAEITGLSAEDAPGKPFIDSIAPQYRALVMERYRKRLAGEEVPDKYEMGLLGKDGSVIPVEVNACLIEYNGKPATLSIVRDITEHKRVEKSLRESEARYRTLFEASAEGILITDTETKQHLYANPAICHMLGHSPEELTRMTVMDIHPGGSLEQVLADFNSVAMGSRDEVVVPCLKKDGTILYANIVAAPSPIDGRLCNIAFFTDITERVATEEKLKDSETRYRRLFETAQDAILILNGDTGQIIDANPFIKDLLGLSLEELIGKNLWEIGEFKDTLASKISYQELHECGYKRWDNLPLVAKDGRIISVEVVANAYQVDHTPVIQCNIRDMTERERMKEILEKTGKLNTTLLESAGEGIYGLDLEGVTTFVNPAAARMIGWELGDLIGKKQHDILHHSHPDGSPYDKKKCPIYAAFKDGKAHHVDNEVFWRKDRSSFPVEYTSTPVWENGRLAGAVVVFADITERKKAHEEIHKSYAILHSVVEGTSDAVYVKDLHGRYLLCNTRVSEMVGKRTDEIIGKDDTNLFPAAEAKTVMDGDRSIMESGVVMTYEEMVTLADNHQHYFLSTKGPVCDNAGKVVGIFGVVRDVSEQKKAENALRLVNQDLKIAQHLTRIGNWKWLIADNEVTWSEELCRINGWDPNLPVPPFAEMGRFYTPESWERLKVLVTKALNTGESYGCELDQIRTDGNKMTTFSRGEADFDANGKVVGLHGTVQDITDRKQSEVAIMHAAEEWRKTFDSITDMVSIHSIDRRIIRVNKAFAAAFNKTPEELIGKHCYELVHNTDRPPAYCPHVKTLTQKIPSFTEEFEPSLSRWLHVSTSPIFDEGGEVVATVHTTKDITERKKLQQQLIMQDRLASIGQLVSGVAHELNNPLTSVIGFSELLLQRELPKDVEEDLKIINDEAKRTSLIVKNLLTFARQQPQEKRAVGINETIQTVLRVRSHEHSTNNIKVNTHFATDLPQIVGNGSQLQQVFFNLTVNAEQAMLEAHKKGTLTITTERVGNIVKVRFTDDGPGISPENMARLFTPFFTTKGVGKGTGLGLSICQGIVTEHGGRIWAESEPGKGTTFILELPIPT